jgi:pSer/pThr/pTyr-binding forkhead associated (FHA) protein
MSEPKLKQEVRAVLYFIGPKDGEAIKLRRDATIFGREKGDILVDDSEVSSTHCQIQNVGGTYFLFDMNSTNGTFLNKTKILKSKLSDGDVISFGKTQFRFALEDDARVRHISTIFKSAKQTQSNMKSSIVDTIIEGEIRQKSAVSIHLKITYKDKTMDEFQLPQRMIYIGRATSFGKFENDPEISRKHVLIKLNDHGDLFVEDQGSTNGTHVNGNKIRGMAKIEPNDLVKIGGIEIIVSLRQG